MDRSAKSKSKREVLNRRVTERLKAATENLRRETERLKINSKKSESAFGLKIEAKVYR